MRSILFISRSLPVHSAFLAEKVRELEERLRAAEQRSFEFEAKAAEVELQLLDQLDAERHNNAVLVSW